MDPNLLTQASSEINSASSVLVLLPSSPDADSLTAALSLHLSLKKAGKNSLIGCSSLKFDSAPLGVDQIQTAIGNQKLVISFDYVEDKVDLVSYDLDESGKRFNLVITPKEGAAPLDPATVQYAYTGASADLVITFGINSLEELGKIYSDEKAFLDQASIININPARPSSFAKINLTATTVSVSELIGSLLKSMSLKPTVDAATNLYRQLLTATNNFQSQSVTAETFELAAYLMRHQASRLAPPGRGGVGGGGRAPQGGGVGRAGGRAPR